MSSGRAPLQFLRTRFCTVIVQVMRNCDARNPTRVDETGLLFGHGVKRPSWRERIAIFWFVGLGVVFWAAVVLALFG